MTDVAARPYAFSFTPERTALVLIDMQCDFSTGRLRRDARQRRQPLTQADRAARSACSRPRAPRRCPSSTRARATGPTCPTARRRSCRAAQLEIGIGDPDPSAASSCAARPARTSSTSSRRSTARWCSTSRARARSTPPTSSSSCATAASRSLVITGITTDVCVQHHVREANDLGYECLVLSDCVGSDIREFHEVGLRMILAQGGDLRRGRDERGGCWPRCPRHGRVDRRAARGLPRRHARPGGGRRARLRARAIGRRAGVDLARAVGRRRGVARAAARRAPPSCRSTACRSRSRTTSTSRARRRRRPARRSPTAPQRSAFVVERLIAAGAIPIGKTNMDQFATGLTGTRTPLRRVRERRRPRATSRAARARARRSSSPTAPCRSRSAPTPPARAACRRRFNGIVGLKPSLGRARHARRRARLPQPGLRLAADARRRRRRARARRRRRPRPGRPVLARSGRPRAPAPAARRGARIAVPRADAADVLRRPARRGGVAARAARARPRSAGSSSRSTSRRSPRPRRCSTTGRGSPSATPPSARSSPRIADAVDPDRARGRSWPAATSARSTPSAAAHRLRELRRATRRACWAQADALLLPTAPTLFTAAEIAERADRAQRAARARTRTSSTCSTSARSRCRRGVRADGLPFGVSLIAPAGADAALLTLAARWRGERCGARRRRTPADTVRARRRRRAPLRRAAQRPARRARRAAASRP